MNDLQPPFSPIEEYGCHRPHCKATGVVTRKPWMRTDNEWTLCDCGLAAAILENARLLKLLDDVPSGT